MNSDLFQTRLIYIAILILISSCSGNVIQTTVFTDGFQELEPGARPYFDSSDPAICYDARRGNIGNWSVATSLRQDGFDRAWVVRNEEGKNYMAQTFTNLNNKNSPLSLVSHPMLVAGEDLWSDYTIRVGFTPQAKFDKCGVVFAYKNPADFFFFGVEGNTVTLKHVEQSVTPLRPNEVVLDISPLVWTPGEELRATITVRRKGISTSLNDSINMYTEWQSPLSGKIGLISDLPAKFHSVEVKLLRGEQRKLSRKKRQFDRRSELHISDHPAMVRWKRFDTGEYGTNQNIRLGDLNGDGNKEIVFIRPDVSGSEVGSVSVINLDGELIWQYGSLRKCETCSGAELPVQVHDLDGDGSREVIFVSKGRIHLLDGQSGKLIRRIGIPGTGDVNTLIFADLLGVGRDNCMLLSDREHMLKALNEKGELLWEQHTDSGSQPMVYDMDQDGRHEVLMGYSVFSPDGELIFDVGAHIGDRCNGVSVYNMLDGEKEIPCLVYAAGDWGLIYYDFEGHLLKQNILGHVGHLGVAELDLESPGLELVTSNRWGSPGLAHVMNASGMVKPGFLPGSGVFRCQSVNWKGDGEEFFITSSDTLRGGLYDGDGQLSVIFPSDEHPVSCYLATDLTGDARDEILLWDPNELWIYTQEDNPRMGNTYEARRIPLYNHSMHQMNRSAPEW